MKKRGRREKGFSCITRYECDSLLGRADYAALSAEQERERQKTLCASERTQEATCEYTEEEEAACVPGCRIKDTSRGGFSYGKSRQLSTIKKRGKEGTNPAAGETERVREGWANDDDDDVCEV